MRLIPVMDLKEGLAVHAVRGERERYQPVKSVLADTAHPVDLARAFRDQLGCTEIYIADLDAIQGRGDHRLLVAKLAKLEGLSILLDAGAADVRSAQALLAAGARKAIIGLETLTSWDALQEIRAEIPAERLVFSLDMRSGQLLTRSPALMDLTPIEVLGRLQGAGWNEVILLDLARVGSQTGVDQALIAEARARFPHLALIAGGGLREPDDLVALKHLGVAGVLAATALHNGKITRQHLSLI